MPRSMGMIEWQAFIDESGDFHQEGARVAIAAVLRKGKAKRVRVGQAERGTEVDHNLRSAILSLTCGPGAAELSSPSNEECVPSWQWSG